ncbi:MAG: isoprenylcysteine carboxylmethyltransferase family protein [Candidatus Thorarchaeota archaeon]
MNDEIRQPPLALLIPLMFMILGAAAIGVTVVLALPWTFTMVEPLSMIMGVVLLAIGCPMMGLTLRSLRVHRALGSEIYKSSGESALITTGIYAYTRNPLYLSSTILFFGWVFLTRLTFLMIMTFFFIILFIRVAKWEENELIDRFGDEYNIYKNSVPFMIPYPRRRTE